MFPPVEQNGCLAPAGRVSGTRRWLPLLILALLVGAAYVSGLHRYVSLRTVSEHRETLEALVAEHWLFSVVAFVVVYIAVVALSLPGAAVMTVLGGFLFGWLIGTPLSALAATMGSVAIFLIVRSSLGATLAERAGPRFEVLSDGFKKNAFNYLLFLRLVPAFPFFAVNAVAGLCGVRLGTFVLATIIGIIPGALVFSFLGSGLDELIDVQLAAERACASLAGTSDCPNTLSITSLLSPQLLAALAGLGVLALVPVLWRLGNRRP